MRESRVCSCVHVHVFKFPMETIAALTMMDSIITIDVHYLGARMLQEYHC